ncbi:MAG: TlpA family protein disulfide reductase [Actinobacteria bacterium]|nr:TlpA family protein disulfide reductase [Actinomycetota bacterium]
MNRRQVLGISPCPASLGPDLPALTLPCLSGGEPVSLKGPGSGKPVLLNVWGSWCPPCVEEIPALVDLQRKAGSRLQVVGVSTEDPQAAALTFARQYGMRYPSVIDDDGRILRAYRPGPPVTLFLDPAGHLVYKHSGKFKTAAELEALVREHLGVSL